jgi:hypothetical protein
MDVIVAHIFLIILLKSLGLSTKFVEGSNILPCIATNTLIKHLRLSLVAIFRLFIHLQSYPLMCFK